MRGKNIYFYIAAALAVIVPVPGRLAFGLLMIVLFNIQIITGVLFCHLVTLLKLNDLKNVLVAIELISITILFKQLVILFCPVAALTLGFLMYLPALSSAIIEFSYRDNVRPLSEDLKEKSFRNAVFSLLAMLIFFVRDIVGYGTLTFPVWQKIAVAHVGGPKHGTYAGAFIATIPGAFVLLALILACYLFVKKQFTRIERAGGLQ